MLVVTVIGLCCKRLFIVVNYVIGLKRFNCGMDYWLIKLCYIYIYIYIKTKHITLRRVSDAEDNVSSSTFPTSFSSIYSGLAISTNPSAYKSYNKTLTDFKMKPG